MSTEATEKPWHASFPAVRLPAEFLPRDEVLKLLEEDKQREAGKKKVVLVDLRRNDHDGQTILTSLNLPAQTLYHSLPTLVPALAAAGVTHLVFYCGSSQGRGSRAASWAQEYIEDNGVAGIRSYALEGGIKGWVKAAEEGGKEGEWVKRVDAA